jgi:hypothetical protein
VFKSNSGRARFQRIDACLHLQGMIMPASWNLDKCIKGELAYSIRLAKQWNVEKSDLLLFQFAKAGKSSRLILSKEPGNVLLRVSYKWAIGYDWVSLGLSCI